MSASSVPHESPNSARDSLWSIWPRFLLFPVLAIAAFPPFIAGWGGDHPVVRVLWVAFLTSCWFCVGGSFHESTHHTLFRNSRTNVRWGRILGILTLIPYTAYRETHRLHHAWLNSPADPELWPYSDPGKSLAFRRMFVWIDLFAGVVTAPYIYSRLYWHRDPRLSAEVRRTIRREYFAMLAAWSAAAFCVVAWMRIIHWDWWLFDPVWVLPLLLAPMLNTARKFVEHLGLTSTDPFLGTRTIRAGNLVSRFFSYFNFDIAIHGPHHRYPRARHFELGPRLDGYRAAHPEADVPIFSSYASAWLNVFPLLWRNPATGLPSSSSPPESTLPPPLGEGWGGGDLPEDRTMPPHATLSHGASLVFDRAAEVEVRVSVTRTDEEFSRASLQP